MFRAPILPFLLSVLACTSCERDWSFEVGDASTDACSACPSACNEPSLADGSGSVSGHVWSRQLAGRGEQRVLAVAADLTGSTLAFSGDFRESVTFGSTVFLSSGLQDAFAVTVDPDDGSTRLALQLGSAEDDDANAVGVDSEGNLLVAGSFGVSPNGAPNTRSLIAKFTPEGTLLWRIGTSGTHIGYSLAIDAEDRIALTGVFDGTLALPDGSQLQSDDPDAFVVLLTPGGMPLYNRQFGGAEHQVGESIAVTPDGGVVVMGTATGKVDFGGGNLGATGTTSAFLLKLDAAGGHVWSKTLGQTYQYHAGTVVPDVEGNLVATSSFAGTLNVGGDLFVSKGGEDALVVKMSPDGTHLWSRAFGAKEDDRTVGTVDDSGRVFVAGLAKGTLNLGGGPIVSESASYDLLLAGWTADGKLLEDAFIGGPGVDNPRTVAAVPGGLIIGGEFAGCTSFGGKTFAASEDDGFIVRYAR